MVENRNSSRFPTCWICKKEIETNEKYVVLEYSPRTPILAHRVCVEEKYISCLEFGSSKADFWESFLPPNCERTMRVKKEKLNKCPYCKKMITDKDNFVKVLFGKHKIAVHEGCIKDPGLKRWVK